MRFCRFVLIAFLLVGNLAGCTAERNSRRGSPPQPGLAQPPGAAPAATAPGPVAAPNEERFTGKITEIRFDCARDASCNMVVDGSKYVHFGHDTRGEAPSEWGNVEDLWALPNGSESALGRSVEVYAAKSGDGSYTIQGRKEYYVRVLGN
ncbi:MAG: hypothetical protein R3B13_17165 [Polyangiaceae bacterium]